MSIHDGTEHWTPVQAEQVQSPTVIKEYVKTTNGNIVILRTRTYASSLIYFDTLFREAKRDFQSVQRGSVRVVQYAGWRYARTFGIEFVTRDEVPGDYLEVIQTEVTF